MLRYPSLSTFWMNNFDTPLLEKLFYLYHVTSTVFSVGNVAWILDHMMLITCSRRGSTGESLWLKLGLKLELFFRWKLHLLELINFRLGKWRGLLSFCLNSFFDVSSSRDGEWNEFNRHFMSSLLSLRSSFTFQNNCFVPK